MKKDVQAVFIDRDGTIGGTGNIIYPKDFILFPFTLSAISLLKSKNLKVFAFSNQPGISNNIAMKEEFEKQLTLFGFDKAYICPHTSEMQCNCRKPEPGLLIRASYDYNLDLTKCVVIGDLWRDVIAASKVDAIRILVKTGGGNKSFTMLRDKWPNIELDYFAENLLDAVNWVLDN